MRRKNIITHNNTTTHEQTTPAPVRFEPPAPRQRGEHTPPQANRDEETMRRLRSPFDVTA